MKLAKLAAILTGVFTLSQATAFTLAPVNAFQCDQQTSYEKSMQDLFIRVNQIGKVEKRRDLSKMKKQLAAAGFTEDDIARSETCGGIVYCPAAGGEKQGYVTAYSLINSGQIYVPSHLFFHLNSEGDPQYLESRGSISGCYFFNYVHPNDHIPIKVGAEQWDHLQTLDLPSRTMEALRGEGIKISLGRAIPGCKPFQVDRSDEPLQAGDRVLAIGAPTPDIVPRPSGREPVGQFCNVRRANTEPGAATVYKTDCSSSPGESGSMTFVRRLVKVNGKSRYHWLAKSIFAGSGASSLNGQPYNPELGSFTAAVGIEADHLRDVLNEKGSAPVEHTADALGI